MFCGCGKASDMIETDLDSDIEDTEEQLPPTSVVDTMIEVEEDSQENDSYNKLYNKLCTVSLEFNKFKQNLKQLNRMNIEQELLYTKKELAKINPKTHIERENKDESTTSNTVIFMSVSNFTSTKNKIISSLTSESKYPIVIGLDDKYIHCEKELQDILGEKGELTILHYNQLYDKYGDKIHNFNGKWDKNPSKLGAYEWFHSSAYEYMWYIEDDVYSKNWSDFFNKYENNHYDIIYNYMEYMPNWYYDNWKVGSKSHAIHLAHLYIHRISKHFSNCLMDSLSSDVSTSHHEIYVPYVNFRYGCSYIKLNEEDTRYATTNGTGQELGFSKEFIEQKDSNIFHPVKIL